MKKCRPVVKGPSGGTLLFCFALPARGASVTGANGGLTMALCLGAACTGCIRFIKLLIIHRVLCLGAACTGCILLRVPKRIHFRPLPRRCLHGVHRQKPTNCGTPFCSIRRESVDSFSEINNKDSCADYFPALFCCQGDL